MSPKDPFEHHEHPELVADIFELVPDRTLPLAKYKYPRKADAFKRFAEIQKKYGYVLVKQLETELNWAFQVLDPLTPPSSKDDEEPSK